MKTTADNYKVERDGDFGQSSDFKIAATSKAFRILSDGLYTDKILAIIRELSCNAYDAHIEAGTTVPFEVKMPSWIDPIFEIRDYGTGLSDEDIFELYTTYFSSTKTDSNDFIGALGLGSKSPFSYVDTFTVESRFNGTKATFTAYIGDGGMPTIMKLHDMPTDEPNGLSISFPVKVEDMDLFVDRAQKVYRYFPLTPAILNCTDFKMEPVEYAMKGSGWGLRKGEKGIPNYTYGSSTKPRAYAYNGAQALQGIVPYPLAPGDMVSSEVQTLLKLPIDIEFPIGDLEVAASREALSYDKRTIENIERRCNKIFDELLEKVQTEIQKAPNILAIADLWNSAELNTVFGHSSFKQLNSSKLVVSWKDPLTGHEHDISTTSGGMWSIPVSKYPGVKSISTVLKNSEQGTSIKTYEGYTYRGFVSLNKQRAPTSGHSNFMRITHVLSHSKVAYGKNDLNSDQLCWQLPSNFSSTNHVIYLVRRPAKDLIYRCRLHESEHIKNNQPADNSSDPYKGRSYLAIITLNYQKHTEIDPKTKKKVQTYKLTPEAQEAHDLLIAQGFNIVYVDQLPELPKATVPSTSTSKLLPSQRMVALFGTNPFPKKVVARFHTYNHCLQTIRTDSGNSQFLNVSNGMATENCEDIGCFRPHGEKQYYIPLKSGMPQYRSFSIPEWMWKEGNFDKNLIRTSPYKSFVGLHERTLKICEKFSKEKKIAEMIPLHQHFKDANEFVISPWETTISRIHWEAIPQLLTFPDKFSIAPVYAMWPIWNGVDIPAEVRKGFTFIKALGTFPTIYPHTYELHEWNTQQHNLAQRQLQNQPEAVKESCVISWRGASIKVASKADLDTHKEMIRALYLNLGLVDSKGEADVIFTYTQNTDLRHRQAAEKAAKLIDIAVEWVHTNLPLLPLIAASCRPKPSNVPYEEVRTYIRNTLNTLNTPNI